MLSAEAMTDAPRSKPLRRPAAPEREVTTVRLLVELMKAIDQIAKEDGVPRARVIETALEWYVTTRKQKKSK